MSVILDVLGSIIIGAMLVLMMMTFQLQMQEAAGRLYYISSMIEHMDTAANKLNKTIALAGIGIPADSLCVVAEASRLVFRTYWDCNSDTLSNVRHIIEIKIADSGNEYGRTLQISQDGSPLEDLGYILYIENVVFNYFDKNDAATTSIGAARAAEILLTFRRDSSWHPERPLRSNLQVKCFFMNSYLQGG